MDFSSSSLWSTSKVAKVVEIDRDLLQKRNSDTDTDSEGDSDRDYQENKDNFHAKNKQKGENFDYPEPALMDYKDIGKAEPYMPPPFIKEIKTEKDSMGEEKYPGYYPDKVF